MPPYDQFKSRPFYVKLAAVLFSIIAIGYLVIAGKQLLSPLLFSGLLSVLLLPFANWLERRCRLPRGTAALIAVVLIITVIGLVIYFIGDQLTNLGSDWPQFKEQLSTSIDKLQQWIYDTLHVRRKDQLNYVKDATTKLMDSGTVVLGATIISLSSMLLFLAFLFIYTFLFLVYRSLIMKFFIAVFLENNTRVVKDIIAEVQVIMRQYILGLMLEMAIVAAAVALVFSLLGVKYAVLLGVVTGLFNLIPYVGIFTALALSSLITFATADGSGQVISVVVTLVVIHLIDSNVLLPLIVGSKVKINALITVIGVVLGEMIWGIPGMFLSIPVIAVLKIIFDRVDSLKPWGILLGDEHLKKKVKKAKQVVKEVEKVIEETAEGGSPQP